MSWLLTREPEGFNQAVYVCADNVTHHDPNCGRDSQPATYETRGDFCCFTCFTLTPFKMLTGTIGEQQQPTPTTAPATPRPKPEAITPEDITRTEIWLINLGRKVFPEDVNPKLIKAASHWLAGYEGDFAFLVDMKAKPRLSEGQAKGVLNCWRADLIRAEAEAEKAAKPKPKPSTMDLSPIPSGKYMTTDKVRYQIDNVTHGKWAGWVFIRQGSEYGAMAKLGSQRPGQTYSGKAQDNLAEILADPKAAAARYGQNTGKCGRCSRTLEDPESVKLGIGPVCRNKAW